MVPTPIPIVVSQHVAEAAALHVMRGFLVQAPQAALLQLARLDERLAAHLDGVRVAGDTGLRTALAALDSPGPGEVLVATLGSIELLGLEGLDRLFALVQAVPEAQTGLMAAFGWCSPQLLAGVVRTLLTRGEAFSRQVGIAACRMHKVNPGDTLVAALVADDQRLRAAALRCAGEIGRLDLLAACMEHETDADAACAFGATRSAVLLGGRGESLDRLRQLCQVPGPDRASALALVLKLLDAADANALLHTVAREGGYLRLQLHGAGWAGNPGYVPWLIDQMRDHNYARLAGESFSLITGLDLADSDLDTRPPERFQSGPNDDPDDDDVAMDEDDGLPWPDPTKLQAWWKVNHQRFPPGIRYFLGAPPTVEHCKRVLREGYQRQRVAAAEYLCLLTPGTTLFPTSAPAWRQQRWLRQMG